MTTHSSLDRASFEEFLASVFAGQKSGLDSQSLSALVELQRSITTGEPNLDRAIHMVADRARKVANATGIAVALLKADQLEYRAGIGSAAAYVGRRVTAVLSISAHNDARKEILRVEDAQADTRIEGAVCRLYGANALLIEPIYRERVVAGVLEVLFSEAHTFQDREVLTYRVMARLVEEAISCDARRKHKEAPATQLTTVPHTIARPERHPVKTATTVIQPLKRAAPDKLRWNVAAAGVATVVVMVSWIAYDHRSAVDASSLQRSNAAVQQVTANPSRASNRNPKPQAAAVVTEDRKAARSAFKRVRVGQNEVDYIAEDVTIRRFTPNPAPPQMPVGEKQVDFGEDVTVRYFASKPPAASKAQAVPAAARSVER
jgi:hypothetical protein